MVLGLQLMLHLLFLALYFALPLSENHVLALLLNERLGILLVDSCDGCLADANYLIGFVVLQFVASRTVLLSLFLILKVRVNDLTVLFFFIVALSQWIPRGPLDAICLLFQTIACVLFSNLGFHAKDGCLVLLDLASFQAADLDADLGSQRYRRCLGSHI